MRQPLEIRERIRRGYGNECTRILVLMTLFGVCLLQQSSLMAHGIRLSSQEGRTVWVLGEYSDGEPMSFARVRIVGPQGKTYQVGNADAYGRFAWVNDQAAAWQVTFEDGQGHRGELVVDLAGAGKEALNTANHAVAASKGSRPSWDALFLGLSIIFFLSGLLLWWKGRQGGKSSRQCPPAPNGCIDEKS